ncbi:MAG: 2-aminoethylphosphonate--pyruvate transaminase, partial [Phycisphaerae bacterium]|nr:2-aminoethylphosphonate--pyruvate transaminase [Phycisphaerae bacterium]
QFRFTPPTHAMLACHQALVELEQEGGIDARAARYRQNQQTLLREMSRLGFRAYVPPEQQSPVITAFGYPADPKFNFEVFCERLGDRGMVIYPGKVARIESFRIGSIGQIFSKDVEALVGAVEAVLGEMGVRVPIDTARAGGNEA